MPHLYILKCADQTLYTGITVDLEQRVKEHNSGKRGAKYTRYRRPVKLVYSRKFRTHARAAAEEARIKRLGRVLKLEMIKKFALKKKNNKRTILQAQNKKPPIETELYKGLFHSNEHIVANYLRLSS